MKKLLTVGINKYSRSPLNGCINDTILLTKVFTEKYGFEHNNVKVLADEEATTHNVLNGLSWLVKNACAGDTLVFHYSGHGSQVPVEDISNTDEDDGLDEILCPVDIDFYNSLFIRDHETGVYFKSLPEGVKSLVILDCCHSGTGLRNGNCKPLPEGVKNRFMAPPISSLLSCPSISIDDDLSFITPIKKSKSLFSSSCVAINNTQGSTVLISGCKDNQTSADAFINGRYHGALTYYLVETLKEYDWTISYSKLIKIINKKMDKYSYEQNPMLEGRKNLLSLNFLS